jgi:hypothetical protein
MGRPPRRGAAIGATLVSGALLAACSAPSGNHQIGAVRTPDGQGIEVRVVLCPRQTVSFVELVSTTDAVVGDDKDPVLWKVAAQPPVATDTFVAGQTPAGFRQTVALAAEPQAALSVGFLVGTSLGQTAVGFTPGQLRTDAIWSDGTSLSPQAFQRQAGGHCGGT